MPDAVQPCGHCGHRHVTRHGGQACTGHLSPRNPRNPGGPCSVAPLDGQTICAKHGGAAPQNLAAGARVVAQRNAHAAVAKLVPDNPDPVTDPIAVLARLAGEIDAVRTVVAERVNEAFTAETLNPEALAYLPLYERSVDRLVRILEALVKSNYIERHAAIDRAQINALLGAVDRGLRLIPDVDLRRAVTNEIAAGLRKLPAA